VASTYAYTLTPSSRTQLSVDRFLRKSYSVHVCENHLCKFLSKPDGKCRKYEKISIHDRKYAFHCTDSL